MSTTPDRKSKPLYDKAAIIEAIDLIASGQVTELRALEAVVGGDRWPATWSGYFDDPIKLADAVASIKAAKGIYVIPNPVDPAPLARAANRIRKAPKGESTQDTNILGRRWVLIDCDAQRPSGISATEAEHKAAIERARRIYLFLKERGWPEPIAADSGNGSHLLYLIDLPSDDGGLVQRCLLALANSFDDEHVKIDQSVFNPSRIWKLYGTLACKGDDTPDRPHRVARILSRPENLQAVPPLLLANLAADAGVANPPSAQQCRKLDGTTFDVAAFIERQKLDVSGPEDWNGKQGRGQRWVFNESPMCEHDDGAACLIQHASGAVTAGCHHDSCSWAWKELRARYEPHNAHSSVSSVSSDTEQSAINWQNPEPLPNELVPVLPFDTRLLPCLFRPWIEDIAERIQCPVDFPAVSAMVSAAALVGRKVGIRPKRKDDWLVVPNLWGACIGRPGVMKTPATQEPLKPLRRLEIEASKSFSAKLLEYDAKQLIAVQRRKVKQNEIKQAIKEGKDPTDLATSMLQEEGSAPIRKRYLINDSTVEKLGELLNENPNGTLVYRDELIGLLLSLEKSGQEGARSFYLEAWNGTGRYTYDRIGRGTIDIEAAIVSIIGGIQPSRLQQYLKAAAKGGMDDDGLIQRFQLAVWPDISKDWENVDEWPNTQAKQDAYEVFMRLDALRPENVGAEFDKHDDEIPYLRFSDAAQHEFNNWRSTLERRVRSGEESLAMESHLAKYRSLIPSLALVIHLADDHHGPVCLECLQKAVSWGVYLESHARRMYAYGISPATSAVRLLAKRLLSGDVKDEFTCRDVYRHCWSGLTDRDEVTAAAEVLVDLNWLLECQQPTPGRTRTFYRINPKIYELAETLTDKTDKGGLVSALSVDEPTDTADSSDEWGDIP